MHENIIKIKAIIDQGIKDLDQIVQLTGLQREYVKHYLWCKKQEEPKAEQKEDPKAEKKDQTEKKQKEDPKAEKKDQTEKKQNGEKEEKIDWAEIFDSDVE